MARTEPPRDSGRSFWPWAASILVPFLLGGLGVHQWYWVPYRLEPNEEAIVQAMHRIRPTEISYLLEDWSGSSKKTFWTADLSGLLTLQAARDPGSFVTPEIARACGTDPVPFHGYIIQPIGGYAACWPEELEFGDRRYLPAGPPPPPFAFCAYPVQFGITGRYTYIVGTKTHCVYRLRAGGRAITTWPSPQEMKAMDALPWGCKC